MILSMKSSYQGGGAVAPPIKARFDPAGPPIQTMTDMDGPSRPHQQTAVASSRNKKRVGPPI